MCTLVMSYEDPLGATTSSRKNLVGTDDSDLSRILCEIPENKEESKATDSDAEEERKQSVELYTQVETQPTLETNTEEQHNQLNANNWFVLLSLTAFID
ncbi:Hypothetical predicted protein [Pelobates cultripes]|uniref:Uncharacterized protein n=1 Tax=Pelobates cultripes TaxID=61616 RepID=A0AAD1WNJ4_PELCU|nr:Hypothetical predicted protein [Pelobates cultripes]